MKKTVWNVPQAAAVPEDLARAGYPPLLCAVLTSRGITTAAEAAAFLEGPEQPVSDDPFLLTDMDKAAARIRRAIETGEHCAVYGDYDVDGITSSCLLTDYLRSLGVQAELYIPDRLEEGYGLNIEAVRHLHEMGVTLIITVDCGVTAVQETAYAASIGVDMIITDHHECQSELPDACAVVNPKRPDHPPVGQELAGVGVAFMLVCALEGNARRVMDRYSDLAAVGTVADVMPLTGENRRIVRQGLEKLKTAPLPGLAALMKEAGVKEDRLGTSTIGFVLAPRINAAGRLGRVSCASDLMLAKDPHQTQALAAELCGMNRERQQLEAEIWAEAEQMIGQYTPDRPVVLAHEGWHQGVVGIVASRLAEAHHVPVVMISLEGDHGKGSCRSYGGFNLFDALCACGDLLESYGGHALAAGLNIRRENIDALRRALGDCYENSGPLEEKSISPDVLIDSAELLSMRNVASLDVLEPCGTGNPKPSFCILDARLVSVLPIGGGRHTSLRLNCFGRTWECVWFGQRAEKLDAQAGDDVDAVFTPQVSEYRGRRSVQLMISALRPHDTSPQCRALLAGERDSSVVIDRRSMACLWRALEHSCPLHADIGGLASIEPRLSPPVIALGLRVFSELSLAEVELELDGPGITVRLPRETKKADLSDSPAWRAHQGHGGV